MIIGIDPGKTGAIAILHKNKFGVVYDCPILGKEYDERGMAKIISEALIQYDVPKESVSIWIEKVHSMPGQGVASMFTFGKGFGLWLGVCAGLGMSYSLVAPQTWKKVMMKDMPKPKDKAEGKANAVVVAKRLFPNTEEFLSLIKHHGRADAILIAEYGRRIMKST